MIIFIDFDGVLHPECCEHQHKREAECREWLRINVCEERPWLALDDTDFWFEGPNLYLVNHLTGLTDADAIIELVTGRKAVIRDYRMT